MMDSLDYKDMVLQVLWDGNKLHRVMCELRMTLFVQAVRMSTERPDCLMPFPACFFDPRTQTKRFPELQVHCESVPRLDNIREDTALPDLTWELLYWVFTNPLTIQPVTTNISQTIQELRTNTNLGDIPMPDNRNTFVFKILPSHPKAKFIAAKQEFGTSFAYHGSKPENFHSIIHRGLVSALNVRSAHGVGTYLSSKLSVSRKYSVATNGWGNGVLGRSTQCVAIVEVVNHPCVKKIDLHVGEVSSLSYHVVKNDEYMQLSHLLLFASSSELSFM